MNLPTRAPSGRAALLTQEGEDRVQPDFLCNAPGGAIRPNTSQKFANELLTQEVILSSFLLLQSPRLEIHNFLPLGRVGNFDRLAADLAVLHVRLFGHRNIQDHGDRLPAIGAGEKVLHSSTLTRSGCLPNIALTPSGVIDFRLQFKLLIGV